ncbi:MAG: DNA-protecting protein DprA [Deltaproteobacteria bacterium]|nr:MAG: DNA-protecting protein DprA [Deltaproteobacteria bacterium]
MPPEAPVEVPAFWAEACRLSARVDLRPLVPLLRRQAPPDPQALTAAGVAPRHVRRLLGGAPVSTRHPFLRLVDDAYPPLLAQVEHPPAVLFLRGNPALLDAPRIAVVGSRSCTPKGRRMAGRLAQAIAQGGGVVVSGLAHGIDQAAHEASLSRTIAVLGQGLDQPLTRRQADLARRIIDAGGLLVSEFLPTHPASRYTFPQRNRVIAGLSKATVVVEAGRRSGALVTARLALAAGREVLAVPGSPLDPASVGCLDLIADGAALARDGRDIQPYLQGTPAEGAASPSGGPPGPDPTPPPGMSRPLYDALAEGCSLDVLAARVGAPVYEVSATLAALELTGVVERLPGERFVLRSHP